ncbi:MAG: glycosyltransferase family 2 protein [Blautia massiliensis (ex Durand et al. 2017)]
MPKVGIVISNYNGWQDTVQCLQSLEKQTYRDFEIILLDDASPNDSVERLREHLPPNTVFLPQQQNQGFAAVNNIGMRRALADGCDWALLLNNDTVAAPDFLETLLRQTPEGAVSCPKMLFMDPPDEIWFAGGELDRATGRVRHLGGHQKDGPAFAQAKQVNFITFCCVLLPRAVIERVGYLDETLFMYCEDVDYCMRLGDAGVPLWFLPDARIWHKAGGSAGGMLSVYYITRNTLYLTCKGKSRAYARRKTVVPLLTGAARYGLTKLLGRRKGRSYGAFRGALDFWRGRMGRMQS